jgi:hypothetical protein
MGSQYFTVKEIRVFKIDNGTALSVGLKKCANAHRSDARKSRRFVQSLLTPLNKPGDNWPPKVALTLLSSPRIILRKRLLGK